MSGNIKLLPKVVPIRKCIFTSPYRAKTKMKKKRLLKELRSGTFVMIKRSAVEGIGVFAIVDIKKGQRNIFSSDKSEWIKVSKEEVNDLPFHSKALIENYCLYDEDSYYVPEYGFKMIDLVIFLNHSDDPNVISINEGEDFEVIKDIKAGEELFVDYGEIVSD